MFKNLIKSFSVFGSIYLSYKYYKINKNNKDYFKALENLEYHDTSRPENEYYGLNWGSKIDDMVKELIDTTDVIFAKVNCNEVIYMNDYFKCVYDSSTINKTYNTIGIALRFKEEVFIVYNINDKIYCEPYNIFISKPFFDEINLFLLKSKKSNKEKNKFIFRKSFDIYEEFKDNNKKGNMNYLFNKVFNDFELLKNDCLDNELKIMKVNSLKDNYFLGSKTIIRSKINKELNF